MSTNVYLGAQSKGRKRDAAATKAIILNAARDAFAVSGYAATGVRDIAGAAGVNAALVARYFGSKEKLFECVLEESVFVDNLIRCERAHFGQHVMRYLVDSPGERFNPLPMLIMGATDPLIRSICQSMIERRFLRPLGVWLGGDDGEARAARILLLLSGFFTFWQVLPLPVLGTASEGPTRLWMEKSLQAIVDEGTCEAAQT
jgi:AcrR family transcriptional regulator